MNFYEVYGLLLGIEEGNINLQKSLMPGEDILEAHYGVVKFITDIGWSLGVFFDCGEWDYVDYVVGPDGNRTNYDELPFGLRYYRPPDRICREIYKSPGYLGHNLENLA